MKRFFILFFLLSFIGAVGSFAQQKNLRTADDGFQWYEISSEDGIEGVQDINGNEIIPLNRGYTFICYHYRREGETTGYFSFEKGDKEGACDVKGKEIIPPMYDTCSRHGGHYGKPYWYSITIDDKEGACDTYGNVVIQPLYESVIYYEDHFRVKINGKYQDTGISLSNGVSETGNTLVPPTGTNSNQTYVQTSPATMVKALYDEAYNTPDSEAQTKIDRYKNVIKADPNNSYGYKAWSLNNVGVIYENQGDLKSAKTCYEYALQADPNYELAKTNLKIVKSKITSQNLESVSQALTAFGEAFRQMGGGTTVTTTQQGTNNTSATPQTQTRSSSSTKKEVEKIMCSACAGSGKCSGNHHCRGTGDCDRCNGKGYDYTAGDMHKCGSCNGTGQCYFCGGRGNCKRCGGNGYIYK